MTVPELLNKAAARVRQGWCQGKLWDDQGGVCAVGALHATLAGGNVVVHNEPIIGECYRALDTVLTRHSIVPWNNALHQTAENVAMTMEFAALVYEESHKHEHATGEPSSETGQCVEVAAVESVVTV